MQVNTGRAIPLVLFLSTDEGVCSASILILNFHCMRCFRLLEQTRHIDTEVSVFKFKLQDANMAAFDVSNPLEFLFAPQYEFKFRS
jgi:hypothetical protein